MRMLYNMTDQTAISVAHISKIYKLYDQPKDRLKEALHPFKKKYHHEFHALNDINFTVKKGETVGILGKNGAGKSTLLKIITGVLTPSSGMVTVNGKIASLLELGAGFNFEYTGLENIYFQGSLMGYTREEMAAKVDAILEFADIGEFIHQPVKMYSSGMFARLAFSVSINVEPDVLIVDEALSVGDARFQAKCFTVLKRIKAAGTAILLVTHSTEQVVTNCDRGIFIESGKLIADGEPKKIVNLYLDTLFGKPKKSDVTKESNSLSVMQTTYIDSSLYSSLTHQYEKNIRYNAGEYRWGDQSAAILDFMLIQNNQINPTKIVLDSEIRLVFRILFNTTIIRPIFGFAVKTKEGITLYNTNSEQQSSDLQDIVSQGEVSLISVALPMLFANGDYFISVGVASRTTENEVVPHDRRYDSIHLHIEEKINFSGLINLNASIKNEID